MGVFDNRINLALFLCGVMLLLHWCCGQNQSFGA